MSLVRDVNLYNGKLLDLPLSKTVRVRGDEKNTYTEKQASTLRSLDILSLVQLPPLYRTKE